MEQLLKALADLLAPYLPKPNISDTDLDISSEIMNELENYDFDDAIANYLDYNNYQPKEYLVDASDCEEIVSNKINEYIDETLRDEIKDVLRDATIEVIN